MNNILSGSVFPLTVIVLLLCLTRSYCRRFALDAIREKLRGIKDVTMLLLYFSDLPSQALNCGKYHLIQGMYQDKDKKGRMVIPFLCHILPKSDA